MTDDELESIACQIQEKLHAAEIAVFPATIDCPDFDWPDSENWSAFIDIALRSGTQLVYFWVDLLSGDELDVIKERDGVESESALEVRRALEEARSHLGKPSQIELGFANAGLTHRWTAQSSWREAFDEALEDGRGLGAGVGTSEDFTRPSAFGERGWASEESQRHATALAIAEDPRPDNPAG